MSLRFNIPSLSFSTFYRAVCRSLLLFLLLSAFSNPLASQTAQDVQALEPGKPIEREMKGGDVHVYTITLRQGEFLHTEVDQRGIDVVVTLAGPGGEKLRVVNLLEEIGPEPVWCEAEKAGVYRLEVRTWNAAAAGGRYQVTAQVKPAASSEDRNRAAAEGLLLEARKLEDEGSKESRLRSIEVRLRALDLWRRARERYWEAYTLNRIGGVHYALGENQKALEYLNQALALERAVGDRSIEAATLNNIGRVYHVLGENQKALEYLNQALPLERAVGDRRGEGATLNIIGAVYDYLGEKQKALEYYGQALPLRRAVGDRRGEAYTLNNIGLVYDALGEKQKALEYYSQARPLLRAVGDRNIEAATLNNIGRVYSDLGEKQKALEYYGQALPLERAAGDRSGEADVLNNIGRVYDALGEKQKALEYYGQALPLWRAVGDRMYEALALNNIGSVYSDLGENWKALEYYGQALPLERAVGDRDDEAYTLNNIGRVYDALGEKQKALEYFSQALPLWRAVGDRNGEAYTLNNIGLVYDALGEKQKALEYYGQALPLSRAVGDRMYEALALNNIGRVYDALGENQQALEYYGQALPLRRAVGDRPGEVTTLYNIAHLERDRGNLLEARRQIEAALAIVEDLRSRYTNKQLSSSYFATVQDLYRFYIDLLMRLHKQSPSAGFDGAALQISERARARTLLETLAEANADIRQGGDPTLLERERTLQQQLNAKAQAQTRLLTEKHTDAQVETIAKEIETLTTEFQQVEAQIRQTSPHYAALTQPQPLTLKQIQTQVLDEETLLLEYSLGSDRSYLWAVTPNSITSYELPKRDEIEAIARRVYDLLNARNKRVKGETKERWQARVAQADVEIPAAAAGLSRMVIAPAAAQLGKKRLVIVADGVLQYIPFAVLPDPTANAGSAAQQPLIVTHEIVSLPSASTLSVLRREVAGRKPAPKTVVALADPVFMKNDERVKNALNIANSDTKGALSTETVRELQLVEAAEDTGVSNGGLYVPRLLGSRKEAEDIVAMVPAAERRLALDFEANRDVATSADLSQYRYVHFSTHGFLNSVHPELSGIVFSLVNERGEAQDGFLRAHEVFNLKLPAEAVVLSACQTGIGKEVKGEGLVSLTRGFMYAGAPRVVVSLWSVSEIGTAELMVRFYREMLKKGKPPAAALRAAQVSLMHEQRWASPFYWSGFTLQGEWR
jgi:CHAT domain-containing protein/tetratricopeptide (TPR) repeat protein